LDWPQGQAFVLAGSVLNRVSAFRLVHPSLTYNRKQEDTAMRKVLFGFVWFIVLYFVGCMGVGGVAGGIAGSRETNRAAAQMAGGRAGGKAVTENYGLIVGGAVTLSILGSGFGILPGTRSRSSHSEYAL
jgi:hypothetical protein